MQNIDPEAQISIEAELCREKIRQLFDLFPELYDSIRDNCPATLRADDFKIRSASGGITYSIRQARERGDALKRWIAEVTISASWTAAARDYGFSSNLIALKRLYTTAATYCFIQQDPPDRWLAPAWESSPTKVLKIIGKDDWFRFSSYLTSLLTSKEITFTDLGISTGAAKVVSRYIEEVINQKNAVIHSLERRIDSARHALGVPSEQQFDDPLSIYNLDLSNRTFNCLTKANLTSLTQVAKCTEAELMTIRNLGKKSLNEIKEKLADHDLALTEESPIPCEEETNDEPSDAEQDDGDWDRISSQIDKEPANIPQLEQEEIDILGGEYLEPEEEEESDTAPGD